MANGKNPHLRYRVINSCLSNKRKRYWTIAELIGQLADHDLFVEKRMVEYDIEAMRYDERLGYKAPIAYCRKNKGFHYTDPDYSIDAVPLTDEDLRALRAAANILRQYKGVQLVNQFEGAVDKVVKVVDQLNRHHHPTHGEVMYFEQAPYYRGTEHFDTVLQAIYDRQPLRLVYRKFDRSEVDEHVFHPYFLKEYRGRWYVLGHSEARHYTITLGLDRIESLSPASVPFRENTKLKPAEYFQHTLGITLGKGPVEEIVLRFSPAQSPYIKTQHLHHTQQTVREDDDGLVISLRLIPNPELVSLILSYGAEVKVLAPASLGRRVREGVGKGE